MLFILLTLSIRNTSDSPIVLTNIDLYYMFSCQIVSWAPLVQLGWHPPGLSVPLPPLSSPAPLVRKNDPRPQEHTWHRDLSDVFVTTGSTEDVQWAKLVWPQCWAASAVCHKDKGTDGRLGNKVKCMCITVMEYYGTYIETTNSRHSHFTSNVWKWTSVALSSPSAAERAASVCWQRCVTASTELNTGSNTSTYYNANNVSSHYKLLSLIVPLVLALNNDKQVSLHHKCCECIKMVTRTLLTNACFFIEAKALHQLYDTIRLGMLKVENFFLNTRNFFPGIRREFSNTWWMMMMSHPWPGIADEA